jgi:hypothetical protein
MVQFGDSLKAIDQRILDKIRASQGAKEYLKDSFNVKGLTNRQAIQGIYDAAKTLAKSQFNPEQITRVRLDAKDDAELLSSLSEGFEALKRALAEEAASPFRPDKTSDKVAY